MANMVSKGSLKATTGINVLFGLWLFCSPWIYHASGGAAAWNSWFFGALIAIFAAIRYANPAHGRALSVLNMLFGAWMFASPWIYAYTLMRGMAANSLVVGVVVFVLGAYGSGSLPRHMEGPPAVHT